MRVCHCGKCKITCNKHGKVSKCEECGKRRLLGTETRDGRVRHICNKCCELLQKEIQKEIDAQINLICEEIRQQDKKNIVKKLGIRKEEDERLLEIENEYYDDEINDKINKTFKGMKNKRKLLKKLGIRSKEDERCLKKDIGDKYTWI
jgi:hypothetical protein